MFVKSCKSYFLGLVLHLRVMWCVQFNVHKNQTLCNSLLCVVLNFHSQEPVFVLALRVLRHINLVGTMNANNMCTQNGEVYMHGFHVSDGVEFYSCLDSKELVMN